MGDQSNNGEDGILDTDIVFECSFCGKSLAIDYRAAGLSVPCSDCGKLVAIPIPDGMELTDLDSTEGDQYVRAIHLRQALKDSQTKAAALERKVDELHEEADAQEEAHMERKKITAKVAQKTAVIRKSLRQIEVTLNEISHLLKNC
jgi:transcription elongation factor Elf1